MRSDLTLIAVDPVERRRGAARLLLQHFCNEVDQPSHPSGGGGHATYLDASRDGYTLYRGFGFQQRVQCTFNLAFFGYPSTRTHWAMVRRRVISQAEVGGDEAVLDAANESFTPERQVTGTTSGGAGPSSGTGPPSGTPVPYVDAVVHSINGHPGMSLAEMGVFQFPYAYGQYPHPGQG